MRRAERELFERLLEEKQRVNQLLAHEIDWLRAQLGRPSLPSALNPTDLPAVKHEISDGGWEGEREEAQAILDEHGLSAVHLPEILSGLGYGSDD